MLITSLVEGDSQPQRHQGFMEKFFNLHGKHHDDPNKDHVLKDGPEPADHPEHKDMKDKYEKWYKEEEREEAEGDTYAGLM